MEPRSFNRGDTYAQTVLRSWGKLQWSHGRLTVVTLRVRRQPGLGNQHASMEPRSFNRGDCAATAAPGATLDASMEPRSFNRGDDIDEHGRQSLEMLQWSHGRLTVVTLIMSPTYISSLLASMEPRSFNRGDMGLSTDNCKQEVLQWSHGRLTVVTGLFIA